MYRTDKNKSRVPYHFKKINIDNIKPLIRSKGIYDSKEIQLFDKFNRFGYFDLDNKIGIPTEYIFFTRPDLNIFSGGSLNPGLNDPFFKGCQKSHPKVLQVLQSSKGGINSPFINILTNKAVSSIDLPSISAEEMESPSNIYGDNIKYRMGSNTSYNGHDFSVDFEDTKYLDIYMIFKAWDEYCGKKDKGMIKPSDYNIKNKILHDQIAVYKFIVDDDKETILHYTKFIGVYPKDVPLATFSSLDNAEIKHTVEFHSQFVEDMNPIILSDFNKLTSSSNSKDKNGKSISPTGVPVYDTTINEVSGEWVGNPYIEMWSGDGRKRHKLKWRKA